MIFVPKNVHAHWNILFNDLSDDDDDDNDDNNNKEFACIITQGDRDRLNTRPLEFRDVVLQSTHEQCEGMSVLLSEI